MLRDVGLSIGPGEALGLVGESGSGKSMTAKAIAWLLPPGAAEHAIVLWRGRVVEQGPTAAVLDDPQHEYTKRLRASVPRPGWKPTRRAAPAMPETR